MAVPEKVTAADWSIPLEFGPPDRSRGVDQHTLADSRFELTLVSTAEKYRLEVSVYYGDGGSSPKRVKKTESGFLRSHLNAISECNFPGQVHRLTYNDGY